MPDQWGNELPEIESIPRRAAMETPEQAPLHGISKEADPVYAKAIAWGQKYALQRSREFFGIFGELSVGVRRHIQVSCETYAMAEYWKWKAGEELTRKETLESTNEDGDTVYELQPAVFGIKMAIQASSMMIRLQAQSSREEKAAWELACAEQAARKKLGSMTSDTQGELEKE